VKLLKSDDMLLPVFLKLGGRSVLLVGGGPVATGKARGLAEAGARVTVVAPIVTPELADLVELAQARGWSLRERAFEATDLDGVWLAIAAAPPSVNREVWVAAEARRVFVVAVDDPSVASAYGCGVVRRAGVTVAVSTAGQAPALAGLLREGLEALLPDDLAVWVAEAIRLRPTWRAERTAISDRRPRLLLALNQLYGNAETARD
jgi:uroporphyrin-III C-methyltransferase/precorrin-2 dehydrogenase/sirohydrochlorin ferrochelatase